MASVHKFQRGIIPTILLAAFLLTDKNNTDGESAFHPFYAILPRNLSHFPIFWDAIELEYLRGSIVYHFVKDYRLHVKTTYNQLCKIEPLFCTIASLEDFEWAMVTVSSRGFTSEQDIVMVPYADMLNHYYPLDSIHNHSSFSPPVWRFEDGEPFSISLTSDIQAGSEIVHSYGEKDNTKLLFTYGFALEMYAKDLRFNPNVVSSFMYFLTVVYL